MYQTALNFQSLLLLNEGPGFESREKHMHNPSWRWEHKLSSLPPYPQSLYGFFFPQTPFQKTHLLHHFALLLTFFFFFGIICLITDLVLYPWCTDIAHDRVWYYISCLVFCSWSFWLRMLLLDLSDENSPCLISQRQIQIQVS